MNTFFLLASLIVISQTNFVRNHQFWYTSLKSSVIKGSSSAQSTWGFCDIKCLFLEHYYPGVDFVYINFSLNPSGTNFAACYVRKMTSNGLISYSPWDTIASNNYFNTYCGHDTVDYYALSQGSNPKYTLLSVRGIGIGNYPTY